MSNPQLGGPVTRTFQLPPPHVPHVQNDASEPQQQKVELWARNCREFCQKWWLPHHFWVLLHAVNLWHGTNGFTSPLKEGALRIFSPKKSDGFGQVWTRELGYQRPAHSPLDHQSCYLVWLVCVSDCLVCRSGGNCSSLLTSIPSSHLHRLIIPDDVSIQFDLLMMSTWCSKHVERWNK